MASKDLSLIILVQNASCLDVSKYNQLLVSEKIIVECWNQLTTKSKTLSGWKVLFYPQQMKNFAAARNWAMDQAANDWVLFLDSDEQLIGDITQLVEMSNDSCLGYSIKRLDFFHGQQLRFGEVGSIWVPRLINRRRVRFVGRVHEQTNLPLSRLRFVQVRHTPHLSVSSFLTKINDYSTLAVDDFSESKLTTFLKLLVFPSSKFFTNYVLKLGFLDGWRGLVYAIVMSIHSLAVRAKTWQKLSTKN